MKPADTLAPTERAAIKAVSHTLITSIGGFDVAELVTGRSRSTLHAYKDGTKPEVMPVDVLLNLERAAVGIGAAPVLTQLLARLNGHLVVPMPAGDGQLDRDSGQMLRAAADFAARQIESMGDGAICDTERAALAGAAQAVHDLSGRILALLAGPALKLRAVS